MREAVVWIHGDCLSPHNPGLALYPDSPAVFVFDDRLLREWRISLKRIVFMYECLLELPVTIRRGDPAREVLAFMHQHDANEIVTTDSPGPRFQDVVARLSQSATVEILQTEPFFDAEDHVDLRRFSRYWRSAERYLFE